MSDSENPDTKAPMTKKEAKETVEKSQVVIRMWPKTPILYPMGMVALLCGIITQIWGGYPPIAKNSESVSVQPVSGSAYTLAQVNSSENPDGDSDAEPSENTTPSENTVPSENTETEEDQKDDAESRPGKGVSKLDRILGLIFLGAMFISLFTICVNLDIRWGLIFISSVVIFILVGVIANLYVDFVSNFFGFLNYLYPAGNAQFYYGIFGVWGILMIISWLVSRVHYVRIEANEVIVVGGMLERQQRYSTMRMRYTKEVQDVLEYYLPLVRSGRLILSFPEQNEAVIIDNVINIKQVTADLDRLISSLKIVGD